MTNVSSLTTEVETFEVLVPRCGNSQILLTEESGHFLLPRVMVPKYQRVAQSITERVAELWKLETVCLFHPGHPSDSQRKYCVVLEPRNTTWQPGENLNWVARDALRRALPQDEADAIEEVLKECDSRDNGILPGPFARRGWLDELMSWAQAQLNSLGLTLTGQYQQLNASPFFSLIRLETDGSAVWFKAVGEPNTRELPISVALARLFPAYVPRIIAAEPSWNGWLAVAAEGSRLDEYAEIAPWSNAAVTLANLQISSFDKVGDLLEAGCKDLRIPALLDQVEPFVESMAELMERQSKIPPAALRPEALLELSKQLKESLSLLEEFSFPNTLGHSDFNPGNVLVSQHGCIFLDWAEAHVGHPFLTFEYLLEHLRRDHSGDIPRESAIRSSYAEKWSSIYPAQNVSEGMVMTPLIAVFAYAVAGQGWRNRERLRDSRFAGYFRALTRRMHREANLLRERRERCLR